MLALVAVAIPADEPAQAASGSAFDPGLIMSDEVFYDSSTMTAGDVQGFLNSKGPRCTAGYTCLKDYTTATTSKSAVKDRCAGYTAASSETAATIIYKVAQSCGINPQVLIVLLQKEQGLVTHDAPSSGRYRSATGYGCPDTAACDSTYYGFFNQVYQAAYQFKVYKTSPSYFNFRAGRNNTIGWHPNASCGSSVVYIQNQATAGLYNYTPYRPNAAALNNMYASGDSCSSYGNRNFFAYFTDWFGSPAGEERNPIGALDRLTVGLESIRVEGWSLDPDSTQALDVHVYVDGVGTAILKANSSRPDVAAAYSGVGTNHGIDSTVAVAPGNHNVCVYLINIGAGQNTTLSCQDVTVASASPAGAVDQFTVSPGKVSISGWALDPESKETIEVHVYVNGVGQRIFADQNRPDIGRHYPSLGPNHGFSLELSPSSGSQTICLHAINVGQGDHTLLHCETINVLAGSPIGTVDSVETVPGGVQISGWAFDPDVAASIPMHIYIDGVGSAITADKPRPDVARSFPLYGANRGFDHTFELSAGRHSVCVYAINSGLGDNQLLNCRDVVVQAGSPFGAVDQVVATSGGVRVAGWAIDPDTTQPTEVHAYVDNAGYAISASGSRPDVGRVHPQYGPNHGFDQTVPADPGKRTVCLYAINSGKGDNALLGCYPVTVG